MEPAVARTGRLDKIRNLLDEIRRYYDKIMVKISNRLVTACRLTSVTLHVKAHEGKVLQFMKVLKTFPLPQISFYQKHGRRK